MQVVVAHYHLNPGGVTQVVLNQLRALGRLSVGDRPTRVGIVTGGRAVNWPAEPLGAEPPFEIVMMTVPRLDYDDASDAAAARDHRAQTDLLLGDVTAVLTEHGFTPDATLLHVHNHALGKNAAWTEAVAVLAERGYRLLLQVHDFAEDFRPLNYRHLRASLAADGTHDLAVRMYPQSAGIHYATLTRRDADVLTAAGVRPQRLHVLPNPVAEFTGLPKYDEVAAKVRGQLAIPAEARLVLYPVRGIRRKNVGELLLHAAISPEDTWHAVTLAPKNPAELHSFQLWQTLAGELRLRVLFDTCTLGEPAFLDALAASERLITTSVAEGFGMVFLEAWLAGKPLTGRSLPEIVSEFEQTGLRFDRLYDCLGVPLAWIDDRQRLADALRASYVWVCQAYGVEPDDQQQRRAEQMATGERSTIDFALLPGEFQHQIIRRAAAAPVAAREELAAQNPALRASGDEPTDADVIAANAAIVRSRYSLETIGRRLHSAYQSLAAESHGLLEDLPHGELVLQRFLSVDRLHTIRFEE